MYACMADDDLMGAEIYPMMSAYIFSKWIMEGMKYTWGMTVVLKMCVKAGAFVIECSSLFPS